MHDLLPVVFTQLVCFLLFIWVIKIFAVGPVLRLLDERRDKIAEQFDQAAAAEKRAGALREEYEGHLRQIDDEARKKSPARGASPRKSSKGRAARRRRSSRRPTPTPRSRWTRRAPNSRTRL